MAQNLAEPLKRLKPYKEFSHKKLNNNDAWHLASLSFIVGGATSSMSILHYPNHAHSRLVTMITIKFSMISEVSK